jgi:hypothetical protein
MPRTILPSRALPAALAALLAGAAAAQTPPPEPVPLQRGPGDRIERITTEDALTRVDEVRVDGQTQSIQVQPKNGAPAYQIQPLAPGQTPGASAGRPTGNAGRSSWRVLDF